MSRLPRPGTTGLTKTQQLRHAKSSAMLKDMEKKEAELARHQADPFRRRSMIRPEPKKVDFTKPGMTKSMMARVKQAEKFKQEYERKQEAITSSRQPKRTPAPVGGDARMGRERTPGGDRRRSKSAARPTTPRSPSPSRRESQFATPKRDRRSLRPPDARISRKTNELARIMNADIVQADPIGAGPINNIVIPPGVVSDNRTTIISIQQPSPDIEAKVSQIANRSIQVISDTLDDQDALETSTVQNRLTELQQARRDFVMAVAHVGSNAVNIEEETPPPFHSPTRHIVQVPDIEDEYLQPQHGTDHPDIVAARKFIEQRQAARRIEEEFERLAAKEQFSDDLQLDVPMDEELYQDRDISWEEDEAGVAMPRPSRVKAYVSPIPKRQKPYQYDVFDPEKLEQFFDMQHFPPCPQCGPPAGREQLHPDLWELDDPWFRPPPEPEGPDLMEFEESDLIKFD